MPNQKRTIHNTLKLWTRPVPAVSRLRKITIAAGNVNNKNATQTQLSKLAALRQSVYQ